MEGSNFLYYLWDTKTEKRTSPFHPLTAMDYFADFSAPYLHHYDISGKGHKTKAAATKEAKKHTDGAVALRAGLYYATYPALIAQANKCNSADFALLETGELVELPAGYESAWCRGFHTQNALAAYPDRIFYVFAKMLGIRTLYFDSCYQNEQHPAVLAAAEQVKASEAARKARMGGGSGYLEVMLSPKPTLQSIR